MRKKYPTDLKDREWGLVEKYFKVLYDKGGRPPKYSKREILNAILYVLRTGCQWRYLYQYSLLGKQMGRVINLLNSPIIDKKGSFSFVSLLTGLGISIAGQKLVGMKSQARV